jgi:hypothetical protein
MSHNPIASPRVKIPLAFSVGPTPPVAVGADAAGKGGLERVGSELARLWT